MQQTGKGSKATAKVSGFSHNTINTWLGKYGDPRRDLSALERMERDPPRTALRMVPPLPPDLGDPDREPDEADSSGLDDAVHPDDPGRRFPGLTWPQERVVLLKAQGLAHKRIAEEVGVRPGTVGAWLSATGPCRGPLDRLREEVHAATVEALKTAAQEAVGAQRGTVGFLHRLVVEGLAAKPDPTDDAGAKPPALEAASLDQRIAAARVLTVAARTLWEHGGYPKTERTETVAVGAALTNPLAEESTEALVARLALLEGGASGKGGEGA